MMRNRSGAVLLEVIVALGILVIFAAAFARLSISSFDGGRQSEEQTVAAYYAQEGLEAARSMARYDFALLADGTYGLTESNGYAFEGTSDTMDKFTRSLTVSAVQRNGNDDIVTTGGTADSKTKAVTSTVTWSVSDGRSNTVSFFTYLTDWAQSLGTWYMDTVSDFQEGFRNATEITNNGDGEVRLRSMGSLSSPALQSTINLDGNGDPTFSYIDTVQDRLYVATTNDNTSAELWMYDISNAAAGALILTGALEIGDTSNGFAIANGYLYALSNATSEIRVFNLQTQSAVANWDIPTDSDARAIVVNPAAEEAYVVTNASTDEELYILDISNPSASSIQILDAVELGVNGNAMALYDDTHLFIGTPSLSSELIIVPLNDTANFSNCNLDGTEQILNISIYDDRLFIGEESGGIEFTEYAIDSADVTNCSPTVTGAVDVNGDVLAANISTSMNLAFLTTGSSELWVADLSDFSSDTLTLSSTCHTVSFYGEYAYLGCDDNAETIQVVGGGAAGWGAVTEIGYGDVPGNDNALSVYANSTHVFIGTDADTDDAEFFIFAKSSIGNGMTPVGSLEIGAPVYDIFVSGNYAYLATSLDDKELIIVNVSTPTTPTEVGSFDAERSSDGTAVYVSGSTAYLTTQNNNGSTAGVARAEFYAINVGIPTLPVQIGQYNVGTNVSSVWVSGNYAYLATDDNAQELLVLNISTPTLPVYAGSVDAPTNVNGVDLWINGTVAYLVTQDDFYAINISTPTSPTILDTLDFENSNTAVSFLSSQGFAFVTTGENTAEVRVVDVNNPSDISLLTTFDLSGNDDCNEVLVGANYVYLATDANAQELQILGAGTAPATLPHHGSYTSPIFDTLRASPSWQEVSWTASGSGSITLRIRNGDTESDLKQAKFVGPDGTPDTYYSVSAGENIGLDSAATGTRFGQWKAYFSGSGAQTQILEDVTLTFQ